MPIVTPAAAALFKKRALPLGDPPPGPTQVVSIPIVVYRQPVGSQWCWAAVAVSVQNHLAKAGGGREWVQCELVTAALPMIHPGVVAPQCCTATLSATCNQPWYVDAALELMKVGFDRGGALTWPRTRGYVDRGVPVVLVLAETAGYHDVLIIAYATAPSGPWVRKADPNYGLTWVPFGNFKKPGRWVLSYMPTRVHV